LGLFLPLLTRPQHTLKCVHLNYSRASERLSRGMPRSPDLTNGRKPEDNFVHRSSYKWAETMSATTRRRNDKSVDDEGVPSSSQCGFFKEFLCF
jgi:hypothetical protein